MCSLLIPCNLIIFSSVQELYVNDPSSHDAAEHYQTNISRATATFSALAQEMKEHWVEYFKQHNMTTTADIVSQIQELEKEKLLLVRHQNNIIENSRVFFSKMNRLKRL